MRLPRVLTSVTAALFASVFAGPLLAQPTGGFIAVLDDDRNNGDSSNTVLYYDVDDMSAPMFAIFAGWKNSNTQIVLGSPNTTGGSRSLGSLAVNPATGLTYVVEVDRDASIGSAQVNGPNNALFGVPDNTEGDYNILTFDFQTAYNDWVTNQGGAYVTYISQGTLGDPLAPAPAPGEHDLRVDNIQSYTAGPPNANEVFLPGVVQKVGEVARPEFNDFTAGGHSFIDTYLEYVDDNTLILLDRPNAPLSSPALVAAMTQADDSTVRVLNRISTTPGGSAPYVPGSTEGGFDLGTTETWESIIIGQPFMDSASPGEYVDVALVNNRDGVTGLWIVENDQPAGTGDQVSFFEITNLTGTAGNGLREFNVGGGPAFPTSFILDDNPVLNSSSNDGDVNGVHYNPNTGDLFVIESGFFDVPQDEPAIVLREVTSYDNGSGQIEFGAWDYVQLSFNGPDGLPGTADDIPDDDTFITEGRRSVYDYVNNVMYFYDFDSTAAGAGGSFVFDWYGVDLTTGEVIVAQLDADESTRGFGTEDRYEFFCLGASCGTSVDPFPPTDIAGDLDGDGFVGIADLNIVLGNWNQNVPPADGSVVPEPASLALFTMAGLAVLGRRRNRA